MGATEHEIDFFKIDSKNQSTDSALQYLPQKHAGNIVESIIRKQGHNISKLARYLNISRCTLYNWFELDTIPFDILVRIGKYIDYDFSSDFPEYFSLNQKLENNAVKKEFNENEKIDYWIMKYIQLLEKYNECLISQKYPKESK